MQSKFLPLIGVAVLGTLLATGCSKPASTSSTDSTASTASAAPADASAAPAAADASAAPAAADASAAPVADAKAGSMSAASAGDATKGAAIFTANCASCHGAAGAGGGIGPVLKGEKSRKDTAAAIAWIKNPSPPMPKLFPSPLSEKDVADVAAYVESL
jgi:mono/diheme cytochrome c family protein